MKSVSGFAATQGLTGGDAEAPAPESHSLGKSAMREVDFKQAMRQVASPVAIVTARLKDECDGLTATAVCCVTTSPATMLVSINREASAERLIAGAGAFAVNFLADEQHGLARLFAAPKLSAPQRFAEGRWRSLVSGSPVLVGAVASFDCEVESSVNLGNHNVYFGRVVALSSLDRDGLFYRAGLFRRLEGEH
jgi:flavin reductase (DIM6/NTAB) family NADH-FMN oxidoreductase RutF